MLLNQPLGTSEQTILVVADTDVGTRAMQEHIAGADTDVGTITMQEHIAGADTDVGTITMQEHIAGASSFKEITNNMKMRLNHDVLRSPETRILR